MSFTKGCGVMYTYKIIDVNEQSKWILLKCNEEDSISEYEPFIELVKSIAQKWNDGEWEEKITSVGDMRYKVKNDPVNLTYQWDDLFGIVFDCSGISYLDNVKTFLLKNYDIK
jgi:hypothetical protein